MRSLNKCLFASVLAAMLIVYPVGPVKSHSWYDPDCCSDHDCEPVWEVVFVAGDPGKLPTMVVSNRFGTKPVTPQTKIRESKDSRMHACIYQGALLCLYMPPGN